MRNRARKPIENKTVRSVQAHIIFDQIDDDFIAQQLAMLGRFRDFQSEQRP